MDQVYYAVKYKGHIWNVYHISEEELNTVLLENRRAEYKITMKQLNEKSQVSFESLTDYDQEVISG